MRRNLTAWIAAGLIAGCAAGGPSAGGKPPAPASQEAGSSTPEQGPLGSPFADRHGLAASLATPLLIDRTDLRLGTTAQFDRIPTAADLNDLLRMPALIHVVISLPDWPDVEPLQQMGDLPPDCDLIAVLPGYPPSRATAEAWNYVSSRLRLVVVVDGPPASSTTVNDLNSMRYLERVIAKMAEPSRSGFERLQRPLSFWKVVP